MKRINILIIMMIFVGFFVSPAIAGNNLADADFFFGINADNQSKTIVLDGPQKNAAAKTIFKKKKAVIALPEDLLKPESFYGYKD